jgi:hypothetical protein
MKLEELINSDTELLLTVTSATFGNSVYAFVSYDSKAAEFLLSKLKGGDNEMIDAYFPINESDWFPFAEAPNLDEAISNLKKRIEKIPEGHIVRVTELLLNYKNNSMLLHNYAPGTYRQSLENN